MAQSIETALLYNLQNSDSGRKLKMILLKMKIRIRILSLPSISDRWALWQVFAVLRTQTKFTAENFLQNLCFSFGDSPIPGWIFSWRLCGKTESKFR